jgi:hypothetical protein
MKSINTMKFVTEYSKQMTITLDKIGKAETYDEAKKIANYAMGLVDGMELFTSTMICFENNGFVDEMDDVENSWRADIHQAVADAAIRTKQSADEIVKLLARRDKYLH